MTHSYTRNFLNHMCMNSILEQHRTIHTTYADGSLRTRRTSGTLGTTSNLNLTVGYNTGQLRVMFQQCLMQE